MGRSLRSVPGTEKASSKFTPPQNLIFTFTAGENTPFARRTTEGLPTNQNTPNSAGTCNGDVRLVTEGTAGFWQKFYNGPKGRLQWGLQFSYLQKNTWSGNNNTPAAVGLAPKVGDTIIMSAFRYYLP